MILVDTSIWVDHLRSGDRALAALLEHSDVLTHPFVIGELACGTLAKRNTVLELLQDLPAAPVADPAELLPFIERHRLWGKGLGYVDVHLLAAAALCPGTKVWTRDKRLRTAAQALKCVYLGVAAH